MTDYLLGSGGLVSQISRVARFGGPKVEKPAVADSGIIPGPLEMQSLVPAVLAEQFDLQQQIGLVGTLPAQRTSAFAEQGEQVIAASCLTDRRRAMR